MTTGQPPFTLGMRHLVMQRCVLRAVARVFLWVAVFSSIQGLVGLGVVRALADRPLVEICTPAGLQWVVDEGVTSGGGGPFSPQSLAWAKHCVWAPAQAAVAPDPLCDTTAWVGTVWSKTPPSPMASPPPLTPGTAERVLLMAPMRAPPA